MESGLVLLFLVCLKQCKNVSTPRAVAITSKGQYVLLLERYVRLSR